MRTEESIKHTIMGIVASTVKLPSGDGEAIAERIIEMLTEEGNLIIPHVSECRHFINDGTTSSATKCLCGKEKWEHNNR